MSAKAKYFMGNENLAGPGYVHSWTPEQITEYAKCVRDPLYFAETYIKIVHPDMGVMPFKMYDFQKTMMETFHANRFSVVMTSRQVGKALDAETPINTSCGWKRLGDVHPGDVVFAPNGRPTTVVAESPVFLGHDCFRVMFDPGTFIDADADHLWTVQIARTKPRTVTTRELADYCHTHPRTPVRITTTQPLDYPPQDLPMDPYVLGVWLGDGETVGSRVTAHKDDAVWYEQRFTANNVLLVDNHTKNANCRLMRIVGGRQHLNDLQVRCDKHIPHIYLRGSVKQRIELLRGLMDTDGSSNGRGGCEFYNKNQVLITQVHELLASLGIKARRKSKNIKGETYWTLRFSTQLPVFSLPRKVALHQKTKGHRKATSWYIRSVQAIASIPTKCITVDDPSHMFLAGREMIPTHNSTTVMAYFLHQILFNQNMVVAIAAHKEALAKQTLANLKLAYENLPLWLQQGILEWNVKSIKLANGSKAFAAATSSASIRGGSYARLLLDEFAFVRPSIAEQFVSSTFPTISSGKKTKIIMVSTPNGMNMFHKFWVDAKNNQNDFKPIFVHWRSVPGRDDQWKQDTIRMLGSEAIFDQEYECLTLNSKITLRDTVTGQIIHPTIGETYQYLQETHAL